MSEKKEKLIRKLKEIRPNRKITSEAIEQALKRAIKNVKKSKSGKSSSQEND